MEISFVLLTLVSYDFLTIGIGNFSLYFNLLIDSLFLVGFSGFLEVIKYKRKKLI